MSGSRRGRSAFSGPTRIIVGVGLTLAVVYTAFGVRAYLRNQSTLDTIEGLREEVLEARAAVDGCSGDLALAESVFRQKDAEVDSLRRAVENAEDRQPDGSRGVAAVEYDAYMETFDRYNTSVAEWETQVSGIRETEARCRELVLRHNLLTDSLRQALEEAGIEL